MPLVENIDGFIYRVVFSIPLKEYDQSCYVSGDFNCNGDGSISLDKKDGVWTGEVYLQPGDYNYFIEIDQYFKCDENRKERKRPLRLILKQKDIFHDQNSELFYSKLGGKYMVKVVSPDDTKEMKLITDSGQILKPAREHKYNFMRLFLFILPEPEKYTFEIDGRSYDKEFPAKYLEETSSDGRIIYQIFPDRFYSYDQRSDLVNSQWDSLPVRDSFYGGNLKGIIEKADYIKSLGTGMVYINPIYKSKSNHRYSVDDYYQVDPMLGNMSDLSSLSEALRQRDISLIFDVVFNHTSTDFGQFRDANLSAESQFRGWYYFLSGKNNTKKTYECFKDSSRMPKLRISNPEVQSMIMDVLQYYGRVLNISFFRFDVADSMDLNAMKETIGKLRDKLPGVMYMAEVWCSPELFVTGGVYDSAMNYDVRDNIISLIAGRTSIDAFVKRMDLLTFRIGENRQKRMMNLVGSHDTMRIRTVLNSRDGSKLAYAIMYLLNGYPSLYYGDETALEGSEDPDCRRTYPWGSEDIDMINFFRELSRARMDHSSAYSGILEGGSQGDLQYIKKTDKDDSVAIYFAMNETEIQKPPSIIISSNLYAKNGKHFLGKYGFFMVKLN